MEWLKLFSPASIVLMISVLITGWTFSIGAMLLVGDRFAGFRWVEARFGEGVTWIVFLACVSVTITAWVMHHHLRHEAEKIATRPKRKPMVPKENDESWN